MSAVRSDHHSRLWNQATFLPHDLSARSDALLEAVAKKLQSNFVGFCLLVAATQPELYLESGLAEHSARFHSFDYVKRRKFVEHPLFRIWLRQATRSLDSTGEMETTLSELSRVMEGFERDERRLLLETDDGSIELLRLNPDPLLLNAVRRDYTFPNERRGRELEQAQMYPISLAVASVHGALERLKTTWFDAFRELFNFVKILVDLIDAKFTSYSSCELTGVIFISTNREPLLLEEDLIHELGHQILENVMELDPLVIIEERGQTFRLPWSGKEREIYGYLHAFFVYLMLYNYYGRVKTRSIEEQSTASDRLAQIGDGLVRAIPELEHANLFTPRGRELFQNLRNEARLLGLS